VLKKLTATGMLMAAAGSVMLFGAPANADTTSGNGSILGGNQINIPISIPIDACGNAIAILGIAGAGCVGGASVTGGGHHHPGHWHPGY
jgi:ChpA-C